MPILHSLTVFQNFASDSETLFFYIIFLKFYFRNFGFLIGEDFWYVVSILDFIGLNVCINFITIQNFSYIYKIL